MEQIIIKYLILAILKQMMHPPHRTFGGDTGHGYFDLKLINPAQNVRKSYPKNGSEAYPWVLAF